MKEIWTPELSLFTSIPSICFLYFFYGLAFFFLGTAIAVKNMKGSELKLAGCLWLLAGFGFIHGSHEWLQLYLLLQGRYISMTEILYIKFVTVLSVVLSFVLLLVFGIKLISAVSGNKWAKWLKAVPAVLFIIWVIHLWNYGFAMDISFFEMADMRARNTFGLIGGLITAYGLTAYSRETKNLSIPISKNLHYAGIVFIFYSVFAGLVSSFSLLPGLLIRVEVFRSISAILIACFIIKALNIFDIETRKKLEHQLKRLAQSDRLVSLGQLAAGIAHEINNPLTNASLNIETLKNKLKSCCGYDDILNKIDAIGRNVDKASTIAKELLQFSHQRELEFIPLNVNDVITSVLTLLKYKLKGITIHENLADIPDVMADHRKLEQVFLNILSNSIEAMPDGGDIYIAASSSNGMVSVQICDTGAGIPAENLSKVFDPFFTTKEIGAGTGLGLSICYGIIHQHNGSIEMASTLGQGTTAIVKLPIGDS
ncbi:MAG: ATP-binding protein [Nitrospirota bacterium]|nr:ATP-binding protein [Nitrospirota bacterium]